MRALVRVNFRTHKGSTSRAFLGPYVRRRRAASLPCPYHYTVGNWKTERRTSAALLVERGRGRTNRAAPMEGRRDPSRQGAGLSHDLRNELSRVRFMEYGAYREEVRR